MRNGGKASLVLNFAGAWWWSACSCRPAGDGDVLVLLLLMNRSIDKWFSQPVEEVRADTAAMSALLYDYAGQNATAEAQSIAQTDEFQNALPAEIFLPPAKSCGNTFRRCRADSR